MDQLNPLQSLPELECLYLEHSPVAKVSDYKSTLRSLLPELEELDGILKV